MSALMQTYARLPVTFSHGEECTSLTLTGVAIWTASPACAVNGLGHAHPAVTAAVVAQADKAGHARMYRIWRRNNSARH